MTTVFEGGFTEPVFGAQSAFRLLMEAMANPGRVVELGVEVCGPAPLDNAAATVLAALADYDTPVWFEDEVVDAAAAWLGFHTGATRVFDPSACAFAVLTAGSPVEGWALFPAGSSSYPDRSATLILPVAALRGGAPLVLRGPGIETEALLAPAGLPAGFLDAMAANRAAFPLGFDLVLVCGGDVAALPRTTRIAEA
ncbi:MAG TPA: phosphonate C-P lyase system protein PhnH [Aquamicrobium sp.]|nr:phosphonate C-P lyase system protein PhnH [Aquamicrobium sp.]